MNLLFVTMELKSKTCTSADEASLNSSDIASLNTISQMSDACWDKEVRTTYKKVAWVKIIANVVCIKIFMDMLQAVQHDNCGDEIKKNLRYWLCVVAMVYVICGCLLKG